MFQRWGWFVARHPRLVLLLSLALLVVTVPLIPRGIGRLDGGGWGDPASESAQLGRALQDDFGEHGTTHLVIFTSDELPATDPMVQDEINRALEPLRDRPEVLSIAGYATTGAEQFISRDGRKTYVAVTIDAATEAEAERYLEEYRSLIVTPNLTQTYGGWVVASEAFNRLVGRDLMVQELVSLPLTLILLVIVFGTLVAAGLPLTVGLVTIPAALGGIALMALLTDASIYVLNIATMLGLAVAIDYSLFLVTRFREELAHRSPAAALAVTMATTGKAVFVSGITVAIGLGGMAFFPIYALRSMGIGGAIVVGLAVFYSLTLLPAALAMLGPKVNRLRVRSVKPQTDQDTGLWHWLATGVMRRPIAVLLPVLAFLLFAGMPFLGARFASPGMDMLPREEEGRVAYEALTYEFAETQLAPVLVVMRPEAGAMTDVENLTALGGLIDTIAAMPGVEQVQSVYDFVPTGRDTPPAELAGLLASADRQTAALAGSYLSERGARLTVIAPGEPDSDELKRLVREIRALDDDGTLGYTLLVGGNTAYDLDLVDSMVSRLPYALGFIMVVTYVVLFLLLGSVILPLKAIAMNLLSITASFGALVWIFQEGHLQGVLGFEPTGYIVTAVPVMMFCIIFGLSMDYEVLMLSRIKEVYEATGDNTLAVARGLERTGRVITSAAAIMVVLFGSAVLAKLLLLESLGIGMAIAVVVDATIVRALLVPATMRLMGNLNWWAPRPLRRLQERIGMAEGVPPLLGPDLDESLAPAYVRRDG